MDASNSKSRHFFGYSVARLRWLMAGLLILQVLGNPSNAQKTAPIEAHAELSSYSSTAGQLPFWLRTNQWGSTPYETTPVMMRLGLNRAYRTSDSVSHRLFDWGFSLEGVGIPKGGKDVLGRNQMRLPEAYAKVRLGVFELWAGRRRQITGITDTLLSSGSYSVSGNSMPIPKVEIGLLDYLPIHFLGDFVAVKGAYAHGWFNVPYIQNALFHQKSLYVRLGKPHAAFHLYGGLNHQVQWGGQADYLKKNNLSVDGKLPTDFRDYLNSVVLGRYPDDFANNLYTVFDGENRIGNHIGTIDLGMSLTRPQANWLFYYQHIYEDTSGLLFHNAFDGLYGLRWENPNKKTNARAFWVWRRLLVEFLTTKNQSGPTFDLPGKNYKGGDNYYNHAQYKEGWSYFRQTIGTPFIMPNTDIAYALPDGTKFFPNNRVSVYYAAFEAFVGNRAIVQGRLSFSRNFGLFSGLPFTPVASQFSGYLSASLPLPRLNNTLLSASIALDQGQLLRSAFGGSLSIRYKFPHL